MYESMNEKAHVVEMMYDDDDDPTPFYPVDLSHAYKYKGASLSEP